MTFNFFYKIIKNAISYIYLRIDRVMICRFKHGAGSEGSTVRERQSTVWTCLNQIADPSFIRSSNGVASPAQRAPDATVAWGYSPLFMVITAP